MKIIGCILFLALFSFSGTGQALDSVEARKAPLKPRYIGLRLNSTFYYSHFNQVPNDGYFATFPIIHIGYYLTKKTSFQIGFAYGKRKFKWANIYDDEEGNFIEEQNTNRARGVIVPLTWRYTLNPAKRLQYFGTASVVPAYTRITEKRSGKTDQVIKYSYQATTQGFNVFLTGTLGLAYQINKQWEGNAELILFNENVKELTGSRISPVVTGPRIFKVIGIGVNYKL